MKNLWQIQHYILAFCLYVTGFLTPVLAQSTSTERFSTGNIQGVDVQEVNNQAIQQQNQELADANRLHDQNGDTSCRSAHDASIDNYERLVQFRETMLDQRLGDIAEVRNRISGMTTDLGQAETLYDSNGVAVSSTTASGNHSYNEDSIDGIAGRGIASAEAGASQGTVGNTADSNVTNVANDALTSAQRDRDQKAAIVRERQTQVNEACSGSTYRNTSDACRSARTSLTQAQNAYRAADQHYRRTASSMTNEGAANQSVSTRDQAQANDRAQEASHSISGATASGELSGPLYEANQRLIGLYNSSTAEAAELATAQVEHLRELELQSKFNSDYRLYEMAVDSFPVDELNGILNSGGGVGDGSSFNPKLMAVSNLKVMSGAGAAAKDLRCTKNPKSEVDAKSYYIFKAAAATYLSAEINDTQYHSDSSSCRAYENFTDDSRDMQVRAIERAANLQEETFEQLCLKINPTDATLRAKCDQYLTQILGDNYKEGGQFLRTREVALEMFRSALLTAQSELQDKAQLVSTAHQNVEKGKAWVKKTQKQIITSLIISAIMKATGLANKIQGTICAAMCPYGCCPAASGFFAVATKWMIQYGITIAYYAWLVMDLIKAKKFLAKWEKKLDHARHYSHLACNFGDAAAEESGIRAFAEETRAQEASRIKTEKERLKNEFGVEANRPSGATGYIPDAQMQDRILAQIARAPSEQSALLASYDWLRMKKGASASLPYDAVLPPQQFVRDELAKFGFALRKNVAEGAKALLDIVIAPSMASCAAGSTGPCNDTVNVAIEAPPAAAANCSSTGSNDLLGCSVGMLKGSNAFSFFLVSRNSAWQDQSLDVTQSSARLSSPVNYMATTDGILDTEVNALPEKDRTGFPLPDTRITTIQNMVNLLEHNLGLSDRALTEVGNHHDVYVQLVDDVRNRFDLDTTGVDTQVTVIPEAKRPMCVRMTGAGDYQSDPNCSCQGTNSCAQFRYPEIATASGVADNSSNLAIDFANAITSGQVEKANVAAAGISQNAANVKRRISENFANFNKSRKDRGLPSMQNEANSQLASSGSNTYSAFEKNSPAIAAYEKRTGRGLFADGDGLGRASNGGAAGANGASDSQKNKEGDGGAFALGNAGLAAANPGLLSSFGNFMSGLGKGENDGLNGNNGNYGTGANEDGSYNGLSGTDGSSFNGNENSGYSRQKRTPSSSNNDSAEWNQIHANANTSLFKIISKRYEKSAFPVLLKRRVETR
jgi:hypothetical protein